MKAIVVRGGHGPEYRYQYDQELLGTDGWDEYVLPENPMSFIEENAGAYIVFEQYLSSFSSEENIRFIVAKSASRSNDGITVFEREGNLRIISEILRCIRTLGFKYNMVSADDDRIRVDIYVDRDANDSLYSEKEFFERLIGFRPRQVSANGVLQLASERLVEGVGFSLVRYNHCEPRVLGYNTFYSNRDLDVTFGIQWGHRDVDLGMRAQIAHMLASALEGADVVGMPRFNKEIDSKLAVLENSFYTLSAMHGYLKPTMNFINVNCHMALGKSDAFYKMIGAAKKVLLVTGRDVQHKLSVKTASAAIETISLPQEARFATSPLGHHTFPDAFRHFERLVADATSPGTLVLVGGGILGKHFCHVAKQNNGVALDLGSLFDAWAGVNSRGAGFSSDLRL